MDSAIAPNRDGQPRSMAKTADTLFDRVWKFYYQEKAAVILTDQEEKIRERWEAAWQILGGFTTKAQAVKALTKKFKISKRQAYFDLQNAENLFGGDPREANKKAKREIVASWIIKALHKTWREGNMDAHAKLLIRYSKLFGLENQNDDDIADLMKKRQPTIVVFNTDPETLKKQAEELMKGVEDESNTYAIENTPDAEDDD